MLDAKIVQKNVRFHRKDLFSFGEKLKKTRFPSKKMLFVKCRKSLNLFCFDSIIAIKTI